jgi:exonuclease III
MARSKQSLALASAPTPPHVNFESQSQAIIKSKILKENAILGGDFNCVENTDFEIRKPAQGGTSAYANAGGKTLTRAMADSGKIDAFRLVHGEAKGGHS